MGHEGCEDGYKTSNDSLFFYFNSVFCTVERRGELVTWAEVHVGHTFSMFHCRKMKRGQFSPILPNWVEMSCSRQMMIVLKENKLKNQELIFPSFPSKKQWQRKIPMFLSHKETIWGNYCIISLLSTFYLFHHNFLPHFLFLMD